MNPEIENQINPLLGRLLETSRKLRNFAICVRDGGSPYLGKIKEMIELRASSNNPNLLLAAKLYEEFGRKLPDAMREFSVSSEDASRYIELVEKATSDPMSFDQSEITEVQELQNKIRLVADSLLAQGVTAETMNLLSNDD